MGPERIVTIGADHPSLMGHFPGHPVVPGVVMLGEVMNAIREMTKERIEFVDMPAAKFMSPLNPGEPLIIRLEQQDDGTTEFTCTTVSRLIASGCLRYRIVADDSTGDS
ncbi:MAG: 3-hydroxylacyl-ACP dehydratase [Nitrospirota bacterium]|nr:3-hydroxylacyl-ACP dehydratase [Nitrospirota bacterium]